MKNIFKKIIAYILQIESRLILWKYKPKIIAITGSVGKTSTKDAVFRVLSQFSYVRKSEKNYNSEVGLPLTILGVGNGWNNPLVWFKNILKGLSLIFFLHKYPTWLVLEVGVGKPGDMAKTASWFKSDVVIITTIGATPAHIEFFTSRKNLIEEKMQLIKTLKPEGLLVLNADDADVFSMKTNNKHRTLSYGFNENADIVGSALNILYDKDQKPKGIIFRIDEEGKSLPIEINGVFGQNHVYASLGALTVVSGLKFNMLQAIDSLKNYDISPGRMRLLDGINESLLIDDTYNSSPFACESALKTLSDVNIRGRKIVILGDMLELGKHTEESHKSIGSMVYNNNLNVLITVGHRAKSIKQGALQAGMNIENIFEFLDSREAGEFIKTFIQKGDVILIKGSQGMRMERVVETILLDQQNKKNLLVRQDDEWLKKK